MKTYIDFKSKSQETWRAVPTEVHTNDLRNQGRCIETKGIEKRDAGCLWACQRGWMRWSEEVIEQWGRLWVSLTSRTTDSKPTEKKPPLRVKRNPKGLPIGRKFIIGRQKVGRHQNCCLTLAKWARLHVCSEVINRKMYRWGNQLTEGGISSIVCMKTEWKMKFSLSSE